MDLSAEQLSYRFAQSREFKKIIRDITISINQDLIAAADNNMNSKEITVPQIIPIKGIENSTAQLIVYSTLIRDFEKRGYIIQIDPNTKRWIFSGWSARIDKEIEKEMMNLIASHIKK